MKVLGGHTTLLVASGNRGKLEEIRALLADLPIEVRTADEQGVAWEAPEETGETYAENARLKAESLAVASGLPVMADDSGLEVDHLGGRPGVRSARFAIDSPARNRKLLGLLEGVLEERRGARFVCVVALAVPGAPLRHFEGFLEGRIADAPRGEGGFGYDPIFLPEGGASTVAELPAAEKNRISHRSRALAGLVGFLREGLDSDH